MANTLIFFVAKLSIAFALLLNFAEQISMYLKIPYCAFDIFQKVIFCLALYTEEVNLQSFVMI